MMNRNFMFTAIVLLFCGPTVFAQKASTANVDTAPLTRSWQVDGVERQALIAAPATAKTLPAPLVFVFHGHGGQMGQAMKSFSIHRRWPEAIVLSPQGLNTPGALTDPDGKKPGWQSLPGQQGDRDLNFFDAMLASLKQDYQIDESRIYVTGHSNGASFTYLLAATRGDLLAAIAPSAGAIRLPLQRILKPIPTLILAGEQDRLVKFEWQTASIEFVRRLNQCGDESTTEGLLHCYTSKIDVPLQSYIYPGGHKFAVDGVPSIVAFFKAQSKPSADSHDDHAATEK